MKEVKNQNLWIFELGGQKSVNIPIWVFIGFQQRNRQNSQNFNTDTFFRLPVTSAHCVIGTGKNPDGGVLLNYDVDDYSQGYGQIKEVFRALTKDDILQPIISDHDFRSPNVRADDVGYIFISFRYKITAKHRSFPTN